MSETSASGTSNPAPAGDPAHAGSPPQAGDPAHAGSPPQAGDPALAGSPPQNGNPARASHAAPASDTAPAGYTAPASDAALAVPAGDLPPRSRGVIGLLEENCTACMLCARECPDWCIYIESHKEPVPGPAQGRPRIRNALDRFAIDYSLCMYCGICVEVCPYDALFWSPEYSYAAAGIAELTHERDRLREWMWTVPPPPGPGPGAPPLP